MLERIHQLGKEGIARQIFLGTREADAAVD